MTHETIQRKSNICYNCGKPDSHFEGKFCSVLCADIYDGIISEWDADYKMEEK